MYSISANYKLAAQNAKALKSTKSPIEREKPLLLCSVARSATHPTRIPHSTANMTAQLEHRDAAQAADKVGAAARERGPPATRIDPPL